MLIALAACYDWKHHVRNSEAAAGSSVLQIQHLAASVKAEEVVMYSDNECQYCHTAKDWLAQNGFAFTECNMSIEQHCETEYRAYGAGGIPFLVIRRGGKVHYMRNGFDSDDFLAALKTQADS